MRNSKALFFLSSMLILISTEIIQRTSFVSFFKWLVSNPIPFLLNYLLVISIIIIISILTRSLFLGNIISLFTFWFLALVSSYKISFLGEPLFPWDITLYKYALNLTPLLTNSATYFLIISLFILGYILTISLLPLRKTKLSRKLRIALIIPAISLISFVLLYNISPAKVALEKINIENMYWIQSENYNKNGFVLSFLMNFQGAIIVPPEGYSTQTLKSITFDLERNIDNSQKNSNNNITDVKPNIIIIMSEAYWDPTKLPSIEFYKDPLFILSNIQSNKTTSSLLSPVFGGGTANVEFEVLTGLSTYFLPKGSVPYQQYIRTELPGLPQIFKSNGYYTIALHPYYDWFYKRDIVYPLLGFEEFESLSSFDNSTTKGSFISDKAVMLKIIEKIKSNEAPIFLYAITMQNHGPYDDIRYEKIEVEFKSELPLNLNNMLTNYVQGITDATKALNQLIKELEQQAEPTIVLFFGDHLPLLGKNHQLYLETGYIANQQKDWSLADIKNMREVPLVWWTNTKFKRETPPIISPAFLGPIIMDNANITYTGHYILADKLSKIIPGLTSELIIDSKGELHQSIPEEAKVYIQQYQILNYEMLFGSKNHSAISK